MKGNLMLILWSGGLDSTYLLLTKLLEKQITSDSIVASTPIRTLSLNQKQIGGNANDLIARNKITDELKNLGYEFERIECAVQYDNSEHGIQPAGFDGLVQPPIWLFMGLVHASEHENLAIGYVLGDHCMEYLPYLRHTTDDYNYITKKDIQLDFPLKDKHKWEIMLQWRKSPQIKHFLEMVWYCDNQSEAGQDPCGKCSSCTQHKAAQLVVDTANCKQQEQKYTAITPRDIGWYWFKRHDDGGIVYHAGNNKFFLCHPKGQGKLNFSKHDVCYWCQIFPPTNTVNFNKEWSR